MTRQLLAIGTLLAASASAGAQAYESSYGSYNHYSNQAAEALPRYAKEYASDAERLFQADLSRQQAVRSYARALRRVEHNLASSLGLNDARARLSAALDRVDKARTDAVAKLRDDNDYLSLQTQAQTFTDQIKALHKLPARPQAQIDRLAIDKLEAAKRMTAMEATALERDAVVQQARADLVAARKDVERLDAEVRRKVDADPDVVAALDRIDQIDTSIAKASIDHAGSRAAYETAADELDRQDWFRYHRGYYDYGYRYGYGSGWPGYYRGNAFFSVAFPFQAGHGNHVAHHGGRRR